MFAPEVGAESQPVFDEPGPNTIVISVEIDGVPHRVETVVDVVSPKGCARITDKDLGYADAHGCPACPHPTVVGTFLEGSPNVLLEGLPVVRVGDGGFHAVCCGPNRFEAVEGDPNVLIDGRPAMRVGDRTQHCGCSGTVQTGHPGP